MSKNMIKVENIHKFFGNLHVLKGVDFEVSEGEVVCIVGPSGSGKSTMLRCLNHLERITDGKIYIDGELVDYREADKDAMEIDPGKSHTDVRRDGNGIPTLQSLPA